MYKRIKRESSEKNTQISLKNILEKVNKSPTLPLLSHVQPVGFKIF